MTNSKLKSKTVTNETKRIVIKCIQIDPNIDAPLTDLLGSFTVSKLDAIQTVNIASSDDNDPSEYLHHALQVKTI
eukprot:2000810-Amphidinium_carterae.1